VIARIPIATILLPVPVKEGLNLDLVKFWARNLRALPSYDVPAITVREEGTIASRGTIYTLSNGRHRVIGSIHAGRDTILAHVEEEEK
jgi:hypothetical protein